METILLASTLREQFVEFRLTLKAGNTESLLLRFSRRGKQTESEVKRQTCMHELCRYSECCYSLSVLFAELGKLGVTCKKLDGGRGMRDLPFIASIFIYAYANQFTCLRT